MNIEQVLHFVVEKGAHKFSFHVPNAASWSDVVSAANDILHKVCDAMKEAAAKAQESLPKNEVNDGSELS